MDTDSVVTFLTSVGASGLLTFAMRTWLAEKIRESIRHEYAVKQFKLEAENRVAMANLESSLAINATEHHVRFASIYERMAERITECHQLVVEHSETIKAMEGPLMSTNASAESIQSAIDSIGEVAKFLNANEIYLPGPTVHLANKFVVNAEIMVLRLERAAVNEGSDILPLGKNHEFRQALREYKELRWSLVTEFRKLLGIDTGADEEWSND